MELYTLIRKIKDGNMKKTKVMFEIKKAHLVGISLGCVVIREIDKLAPGRAESIILGGAIIQFNKTIKVLPLHRGKGLLSAFNKLDGDAVLGKLVANNFMQLDTVFNN